jgi:phosphoribosylaminoimidazole-succinocarboxamide synthase
VKDVYQEKAATDKRFGSGFMLFGGDHFSVFDFGKMPWEIAGHGDALYRETLRFFQVLEAEGIPTHFTGDRGERKAGIRLARMLGYNDIKPGESIIYRIPIECIFTHVLTPVASLHKRLRTGKADPAKYGLSKAPEKGETVVLPTLGTTYSTKIETKDVYKDLEAMAKLAGLVGNEAGRLDALTLAAAEALIRDSENTGFVVADGKFEYVMGPGRNIIAADTCYSWDENRFIATAQDGRKVDLSKQFARNIYNIRFPDWKKALSDAQEKEPEDDTKWPQPPELRTDEMAACVQACDAVKSAITREAGCDRKLATTAKVALDVLDRLKEEYHRDETGEPV